MGYSLISLGATGAFIWAYLDFGPGSVWYDPIPGARPAALVLMPFILLLIVGRISTKTGDPDSPLAPMGIYRLCRHPGSLGILAWSLLHLANTEQGRNVIAFATMAAISGAAMAKNEWVRRMADRKGVEAHMVQTSIVPMLAIVKGRQKFVPSEIGWTRVAVAAVLYGMILWTHPILLGADPLAPYR